MAVLFHSVRLLSHELEELDYSLLYKTYSAKGRNPAVDPKTMFKILTCAYSQNIYSSKKSQTIYNWHTADFQGRNNYCRSDPDATFMHMKDDHMRNTQLKPGYNVQIAVDSEYIVTADIFQARNNAWTLVPFLKTMRSEEHTSELQSR